MICTTAVLCYGILLLRHSLAFSSWKEIFPTVVSPILLWHATRYWPPQGFAHVK